MMKDNIKCLLLSDFNVGNLANYLSNYDSELAINADIAPYGQVMQALMDSDSDRWKPIPDAVIVWTQPERVIKPFSDVIDYKDVSIAEVLDEVDAYADAIIGAKDRAKSWFVPSWVVAPHYRGYGMLDMKHSFGISNILAQMNLRLAERLEDVPNIYLLNAQKWIVQAGRDAFSSKLWYMAKIPFSNEVFKEAVEDIYAALRGIAGMAKKLIVVDLDNTLWGGVVGDLGWENVRLGGHDPIGEAFVEFQKTLKTMTNRGILIAVASKNEEAVALEAMENHPEMVLTSGDFAGWKIDWNDKAQNIVDLVDELNLGLQSVVFIDDNPVERARVREALPEVHVPDWPENKMDYTRALMELRCFDVPSFTQEDAKRAKMYASRRKRDKSQANFASVDEWLESLNIEVTVEELASENLQRTSQLLNKTNQMNLSTRRMTESELLEWADEENHRLWVFRVSDKYGDSGLTGIASVDVSEDEAKVVDFILSCRVMGRRVEETMLHMIVEYARSNGLNQVSALYAPTAKNKPCLDFWKQSGFAHHETTDTFIWNTVDPYPLPDHIELKISKQSRHATPAAV